MAKRGPKVRLTAEERKRRQDMAMLRWRKSEAGKAVRRAYRAQEHVKSRENYRRVARDFGLSAAQYDSMVRDQGNSCAICFVHQSALNYRLVIDHCHASGKVRALLCRLCNAGLGHFRDSPVNLSRAILYLNKHTAG